MNESLPYKPLGWPQGTELTAVLEGVDSSWTFEISTRHPPRQIREMYGDWRTPKNQPGPLAEPMKSIPQKVIDKVPPKVLDNLAPERMWFCTLRVYVIAVENVRRVAIYTTKLVQDNKLYQATFKIDDSSKTQEETLNGLRQALIQFQNALGLGP